jgi:uncharacterized protein YjdB
VAANRRALARGCLLAATLSAACVDGPTSPGSFGEMRIRPSYPAADAPSALGLAVDSARVRVVRPSDASGPLIDAMVSYTSDTASLGWLLELIADEESMQVDIEIWDDGARVYAGDDVTLVRDAGVATALVAPVMMAYVGPAIADTVILTPDSLEFDALNDTEGLSGEVRDRHGMLVAMAITWSSDDETVATVDAATGVVTAVGNGETAVRGSAGGATGSVSVSVSQRMHAVTIAPAEAALLSIGATQQFAAVAEDRLGSEVLRATITWTTSDQAIASVDGATGLVTAVSGGSATITATSGDVDGTATVTVSPVADVASVTVSPASGTLNAIGATQQFTATARDAGGNVLAGIPFTWASGAPSVADVDASTGLAAAVAHGETTIAATANGVTGTATLMVDLTQTVTSVSVEPDGATLTAIGATQQFTATAFDASGAAVPGIALVWASLEPSVASIEPFLGLATATGHGVTAISATANGVSGTATLTVDLTSLVGSVVVDPVKATLTAFSSAQQFTAEARDASGTVLPGVTVFWSVDDLGVATIDAGTGLATAVSNGVTTVTATVNGVSSTASLTVSQQVSRVEVSPETATIDGPGAMQQFTARAYDANDHLIANATFTWASLDGSVATVNDSGLAIAVTIGTVTVKAYLDGHYGYATLTVR